MAENEATPVVPNEGTLVVDAIETEQRSRFERVRQAAGLAARVAVAGSCMVAFGYLGVAAGNAVAPATVTAGPLSAEATMAPTLIPRGGTEIPTQVGSVLLPETHQGAPIEVSVALDGQQAARSFEERRDLDAVTDTVEAELRPQIRSTVIETAGRSTAYNLAGNVTGLLAYAGLAAGAKRLRGSENSPQLRRSLAAFGVAATMVATAAPYSIQPAVTQRPNYGTTVEYTGLLVEGKEYIEDFDTYSRRFSNPLNQLLAIREITESLREQPELRDVEICLYLYADPHGGGYRLATELNEYDQEQDCIAISVVLGDLVDWGQSFENARDAITQLPQLKGRVFVVKGNHDSRNTMNTVADLEGVTDLGEEGEAEVGGVRFIGITDPTFTPNTDGSAQARELADEEAFQAGVRKGAAFIPNGKPVIVFAHRPDMLEGFLSQLDEEAKRQIILVAAGHTHTAETSTSFQGDGIPYVNPGSVSGGMLRLVDPATGEANPLSAATAYIVESPDEPGLRTGRVVTLSEDLVGEDRGIRVFTPTENADSDEGGAPQTTLPR